MLPGGCGAPSVFRDTCRAVEIIAGNKPVSLLTLIKQLRGGTRAIIRKPGGGGGPCQDKGVSLLGTGFRRVLWGCHEGNGSILSPLKLPSLHPAPPPVALCQSVPSAALGSAEQRAGMGMMGPSHPCDECGRSQPQSRRWRGERGDYGPASARHRGWGMERDVSNRSSWKKSHFYIC